GRSFAPQPIRPLCPQQIPPVGATVLGRPLPTCRRTGETPNGNAPVGWEQTGDRPAYRTGGAACPPAGGRPTVLNLI
ncbi:MAG: hypothetical protein FWG68_07875, partial [Defluviitaleaceae bacterium]|nr:hypothetical protein [Defluviitaleaceae bacterium]